MVYHLGIYLAAKTKMLIKTSFNIGMYFIYITRYPEFPCWQCRFPHSRMSLGSFFLSALSSWNVDFHIHACLMVTVCLLQIQPLHLQRTQKEAAENRTCLICCLLQRKVSMMPLFSARFLSSDLIGQKQVPRSPLIAMNSLYITSPELGNFCSVRSYYSLRK